MKTEVCCTKYISPVGVLTLAGNECGLTGLWIHGQKYFGAGLPKEMKSDRSLPILKQTMDWLDRYFAQEKPEPSELSLCPQGTAFRKSVWEILCQIPYGDTVSYGEIARKLVQEGAMSRASARAVGGAVGHNPISIIIPCHRVLGADGSLTGYAGGTEIKIRLLEHEGAAVRERK